MFNSNVCQANLASMYSLVDFKVAPPGSATYVHQLSICSSELVLDSMVVLGPQVLLAALCVYTYACDYGVDYSCVMLGGMPPPAPGTSILLH